LGFQLLISQGRIAGEVLIDARDHRLQFLQHPSISAAEDFFHYPLNHEMTFGGWELFSAPVWRPAVAGGRRLTRAALRGSAAATFRLRGRFGGMIYLEPGLSMGTPF
ncbi:MAG TPA: hypothetical protein PLT23_09110, partial [Lentisphaeria bacterium]|nr:hypothetical protein [Lentisphaeria bacterium]